MLRRLIAHLKRRKRQKVIQKAMRDPVALRRLAMAMVSPIRGPGPVYPPRGCVWPFEEERCPLPTNRS